MRLAATRGQGYGPLRRRTVHNFTMGERCGPLWAGRRHSGPLWPWSMGRAIDGRYQATGAGSRGPSTAPVTGGGAGQKAVDWAACQVSQGSTEPGSRPGGGPRARSGPRRPNRAQTSFPGSRSHGPERVPHFAEDYSHQCTHRWPVELGGSRIREAAQGAGPNLTHHSPRSPTLAPLHTRYPGP